MVKGEVVLLAGRRKNRSVNIYNPKTKTWRSGKPAGTAENPVEIHHTQCVAVGNNVWIVSSWTGGFPFEKNSGKVYVYNVKKDKWSTFKGMPANRDRGGGACVRRGNLIYVVGGNRGGHGAHAQSLPWMDAYNFRTKKWILRLPSMPDDGRDHVAGAMVGNSLCIAGGRDGGTAKFFRSAIKEVYCYSFKTKKWSKKQDLAVPRAGAMTGTTCDGHLMIAGGEGFGQAYKDVDVFDGKKWSKAPDMVQARHGSGLAVSDCSCKHIFVPSGSGNQGGGPELTSTEEFIPAGSRTNCAKY